MSASVPLADAALFGTLPERVREELLEAAEPMRIAAQEWLFREGDPADRLYFVVSGRLRVGIERDGGLQVVRLLGPGSAIGELAILTGSRRSASVRAVRDSELLELDGKRFLELLARDQDLGGALLSSLARQLQQSGGLTEPDAPPTVFTLAPVPGTEARPLWDALCRAFTALGTTAVVEEPDTDDWGRELAALEAGHDHVLLLAPEGNGAWAEFCLRQADRSVLAATGPPPAALQVPEGCDVAFLSSAAARSLSDWRDAVRPRTHHVVSDGDEQGAARVARRLTGRSLGLVLSGGGARAYAHIGVIEVLAGEGIEIDRIGGTSMGAFIGAMVAMGMEPAQMVETVRREVAQRHAFSDYTVPRHALIRARRAETMFRRVLGELTVEELPRPLFTISADLLTGAMVVHDEGLVWEAVGASMAVPGLAPPLARGSTLLIDGGILNNLPIDVMAAREPGPVVAVDVMHKIAPPDGDGSAATALPTILEVLSRATVLASIQRADANRGLARVVISPDVHDLSLRDFRRIEPAVDAGRRAAEEALAAGLKDQLVAAVAPRSGRAAVPLAH
jgi:NTE family protein